MTENKLTFLGHVREFRSRLIWTVIAFLIAVPVAYYFTDKFFSILTSITPNIKLIYTEVTGMLGVFIKVNLILAFILTLPFIVYQLIMFINPALTRNEKRYVYILLPCIFILFIIGALFAYFVLLPPALNFLLTFNTNIAEPMIKIDNYISIVTTLIFWIGLCFEIPLIIFFLSKIGIVKTQWLIKFRKLAIIIALILGAVITPTIDPVNQILATVPIIVLYEFGILLSRFARKKQESTAITTDSK